MSLRQAFDRLNRRFAVLKVSASGRIMTGDRCESLKSSMHDLTPEAVDVGAQGS